jgi:hypothetical protein
MVIHYCLYPNHVITFDRNLTVNFAELISAIRIYKLFNKSYYELK